VTESNSDDVQPESPEEGVEAVMVAADEHHRVRTAMTALPEKDRQVLRWLFFEERDKDDVCRALGVDRQYLRVLVHRAKARLRDALLESPAGPRPMPASPGAETAPGGPTLSSRERA